jgi:type IV pilus assembly protein PilO
MTNLQAQEPKTWLQTVLTRERVLWGVPVLVGGLAALSTGVFLVLPAWNKLQEDQAQLTRLTALAQSVPQFRRKIERAERRQRDAQLLQSKLMSLIAGSGDISTFMAQIGIEASRSGVRLDSYEPPNQAAAPGQQGASPAPPAAGQNASEPTDPLLAQGLQKTELLITAHGSAPNLLTFLRRLESLSLLVVQSDLSLKQEIAAPAAGSNASFATTTLKLKLTLYSKKAPASPATASPATPPTSATS